MMLGVGAFQPFNHFLGRVAHPFTHRFSFRRELWRAPSLRFVQEPALSGAEGAGAMPPKAGGWFVVTHLEVFAKGNSVPGFPPKLSIARWIEKYLFISC